MELKGEIKEIIFQNEINSYTIAVLQTEFEEITVVGYLPFMTIGDSLKLEGKYVEHPEYGRQFKIETFEKIMPETLDSLERYLGNGTIKGVGPALAKRIVDYFGDETLYVLKFEPEKLGSVKGITKNKGIEIANQFNENWELWQIVGFLERFGIGVQNAKNVYKALGVNAIQEIEANPYVLIDVANNVDFKLIDKMALEMGVALDNEKRVRSGIKYALIRATYNGHCAVTKENLFNFVKNLLNVNDEAVENTIINMKAKQEVYLEERDGNLWIYLYYYYEVEQNIAGKLLTLDKARNIKKISHLSKEIKEIEKKTNIFLSEKQKEAIEAVNDNNVCIITGGPGTGKTTIIKTIIELYKKHKKKAVLCAPTGRAAKRMTETTGEEAKTLHRLLEIGKIEDEGNYENVDFEIAPLDADVVIIDEMSMVDVFLMNYLVKALYQGTKLILVGDVDQLPSVGPGNVLQDLINSEQITTITLNKIFRQAAKSKIILNSHRINNGESFVKKEDVEDELKEDFFFIKETNQEKILEQVISLCNGRLKKMGDYEFFKNIQVITPTKKGSLGPKELNRALQEKLNPHSEKKAEKNVLGTIFRVGDKVMQVKNNYDIYWEKKALFIDNNNEDDGKSLRRSISENGTGVFNGELGIIEKIDDLDKQIKVKFDDDKIVWYQYAELDQLEHPYAITVHKAQRKRV